MNITLRDVPRKLHARLKKAARVNGRSLNTEAISALEREYLATPADPLRQLQLIQAARTRYPVKPLTMEQLKQAIAKGRE
ncbi:MAG: FitA-like ribbon-helix-helix domain-containing protein [Chthoniobacterales bacterium]